AAAETRWAVPGRVRAKRTGRGREAFAGTRFRKCGAEWARDIVSERLGRLAGWQHVSSGVAGEQGGTCTASSGNAGCRGKVAGGECGYGNACGQAEDDCGGS